jgi:tRNA (cmo5U34)-methyltransferase
MEAVNPGLAVTPVRQVGDGIRTGAGRWSFGGEVAASFDGHVSKSVPLYTQGHELILTLSDFFVHNDSLCYELGCSTGTLISQLARKHADFDKARFIGIDREHPMIDHARKAHAQLINLSFLVGDVTQFSFEPADLIVAYYVMQFIPPKHRQPLFDKIYAALNWGSALVLFEKTRANDARFQDIFTTLYNEYKLTQGYDATEILGKTMSLKGVLEPFSTEANYDFLRRAGFKDVICIQKYLSFEGFLAIK